MKTKSVVIIAPSNDVHAIAVAQSINKKTKTKCYIWDTGSKCNERNLTYKNGLYILDIDGQRLTNEDIGSIWWRRPRNVTIPSVVVDPQAKRHIIESHSSLMNAFLHSMEDRTINSVAASYRTDDKALQLLIAESCGLKVPQTVISNNFEEIYSFSTMHDQIVMKPLTLTWGCFPEARIIDEKHISNHRQEIELAPTIYQQAILPAIDYRVTVVGEEIFTVEIKKNNIMAQNYVDWRIDSSSECIRSQLPLELEEKILLFMKKLGLYYGAIDIRATSTDYYFLEINTAGQYLWVEVDTALPISSSMGELLLNTAG
ncbi:MvdC/MvdD family ATP grasp protein [Lysinibacillus sphaericus]|uniref:MvdC/MvdD family ATP grasp protein n=1 Tax=Lysinibacillus sphaericus TaxID=1421 RepID=UPI0012D33ECF|nr:hypothetical protein [Lysinibacillus sphaericus]QPA60570.1 hypothetical protein INQ55_09670 [Lysinibacillus sphaericus]